MARIYVLGADVNDTLATRLEVRFEGLARRIVDRDTAIAWMQDGHSLLPQTGATTGRALQLVEVESSWWIRDDHEPTAADALPTLPAIAG